MQLLKFRNSSGGVIGSGPIQPCSDGSSPVTCAANPCDSASCEGEPGAECRVNRCGSCTAEFYVGQTKISNAKCAGIGKQTLLGSLDTKRDFLLFCFLDNYVGLLYGGYKPPIAISDEGGCMTI